MGARHRRRLLDMDGRSVEGAETFKYFKLYLFVSENSR